MSKKTLKSRIDGFATLLNDNSNFFCGDELSSPKAKEKLEKARKSFASNCTEEPLLIIDATVFGSCSEGVIISEQYIYFKSQLEEPGYYYLQDLSGVIYSSEDKALMINGKKIQFYGSEFNGKMQRVAQQLNEHISSLGIKYNAQKGRKQYYQNLLEQVNGIQNSLENWADDIEIRVYKNIEDYVNSGMAFGGEGFFQRQAIKLARSRSEDKYREIMGEIYGKIISTNGLTVIKNCNQEFRDEEIEEFRADAEVKLIPVTDSSLDNLDWSYEMTSDFESLARSAKELAKSLYKLKDKLKLLIEDEDEDEKQENHEEILRGENLLRFKSEDLGG